MDNQTVTSPAVPSSAEAIALTYQTVLGRLPDGNGLAYFTAQVASGAIAPDAIAQALADSAEFAAAHAGETPADIVVDLYMNALGRAPEPDRLAFWADPAQPLGVLANDLATSAEAKAFLQAAMASFSGQPLPGDPASTAPAAPALSHEFQQPIIGQAIVPDVA